MCDLEEFVRLLEEKRDFREVLKSKLRAAIIDKNLLYRPMD